MAAPAGALRRLMLNDLRAAALPISGAVAARIDSINPLAIKINPLQSNKSNIERRGDAA